MVFFNGCMPPKEGPREVATEVETSVDLDAAAGVATEADIEVLTGVDVNVQVNAGASIDVLVISPTDPALVLAPSGSVERDLDR